MTDERVDVVVAGAGVVGTSVARRVAARGGRVLLVDAAAEGGLGSRAAAGVDVPSVRLLDDPPMLRFALRGWQALHDDLERLGGGATLRRPCGVLRPVASGEEAERLVSAARETPQLLGSWVDADELAEIEPRLDVSGRYGAFHDPRGGVVNASAYVDALLADARDAGARVLLSTRLEFIEPSRTAVETRLAGRRVSADRLVLAAGAWSGAVPGLPRLPVSPLRGQILRVAAAEDEPRHVVSGPLYLAPAPDRTSTLVGATEERVGFEPGPSVEGVLMLAAHAARSCPTLASRTMLAAWGGFRAATPDGRPLVGPLPGLERVIVAAGHGSQGILTGALTGQLVDEILNGGEAEDAFSPARPSFARSR